MIGTGVRLPVGMHEVFPAAFASLRWGEAIALRRCDLDLATGAVRVRAAFTERSTGQIVLGPPKSRAGRLVVGIPGVILPALIEHLAIFTGPEPDALVFPGPMGGPLRRGNFNRQAARPQAMTAIGASGLHFHDLRFRERLGGDQRSRAPGSDGADGP